MSQHLSVHHPTSGYRTNTAASSPPAKSDPSAATATSANMFSPTANYREVFQEYEHHNGARTRYMGASNGHRDPHGRGLMTASSSSSSQRVYAHRQQTIQQRPVLRTAVSAQVPLRNSISSATSSRNAEDAFQYMRPPQTHSQLPRHLGGQMQQAGHDARRIAQRRRQRDEDRHESRHFAQHDSTDLDDRSGSQDSLNSAKDSNPRRDTAPPRTNGLGLHGSPNSRKSESATPNWSLFGRQLSQIAGDMSATVQQNELIISLLDRLVTLSEAPARTQAVRRSIGSERRSAFATPRDGSVYAENQGQNSPFAQFTPDHGHAHMQSMPYEQLVPASAPQQVQVQVARDNGQTISAYPSQPQQSQPVMVSTPQQQSRMRSVTGPASLTILPPSSVAPLTPALPTTASMHDLPQRQALPQTPQHHQGVFLQAQQAQSSPVRRHIIEVEQNGIPPPPPHMQSTSVADPHRSGEVTQLPSPVFADVAQDGHPAFDPVFAISDSYNAGQADDDNHYENNDESFDRAVEDGNGLPADDSEERGDVGNDNDNSHNVEDDEDDEDADGNDEWKQWQEPQRPPSAQLRNLPRARYTSLREVRQERKQKTNRSLATIGRIPLKEYLELKTAAEYRAVRRLARTVYAEWLEQNVRLAKQEPQRVQACIHKIEHDFPILADCEGHWKAKELMLQVIDNAIDEVAFHRRKQERQTVEVDSDSEQKLNMSAPMRSSKRRSAEVAGLDASTQGRRQRGRSDYPLRGNGLRHAMGRQDSASTRGGHSLSRSLGNGADVSVSLDQGISNTDNDESNLSLEYRENFAPLNETSWGTASGNLPEERHDRSGIIWAESPRNVGPFLTTSSESDRTSMLAQAARFMTDDMDDQSVQGPTPQPPQQHNHLRRSSRFSSIFNTGSPGASAFSPSYNSGLTPQPSRVPYTNTGGHALMQSDSGMGRTAFWRRNTTSNAGNAFGGGNAQMQLVGGGTSGW